jgi:hypothetical protein
MTNAEREYYSAERFEMWADRATDELWRRFYLRQAELVRAGRFSLPGQPAEAKGETKP